MATKAKKAPAKRKPKEVVDVQARAAHRALAALIAEQRRTMPSPACDRARDYVASVEKFEE